MTNNAVEIEEKAAKWLVRRDSPDWSDSDQTAFDDWIAQSTANRIAVVRLETVWQRTGRLRASALLAPGHAASTPTPEEIPAGRQPFRRGTWLAAAALAASIALISIPVYNQREVPESYSTPVGGFQQLPLADGSRVELNTNTDLAVSFSASERRVQLERGEAFFNVAKDRERPFIVQAGAYRVIAVGTAFTVKLRGDEVNVLVTEGRVRIEGPATDGGPQRASFASAGQVAVAANALPVVRPVPAEQVDGALSWREGLLIFEGRPLGEVASEFNRYNREQLVVDPSATGVVVDGTFRATNIEGFLRLLREGFGVQAFRDRSSDIILKKI